MCDFVENVGGHHDDRLRRLATNDSD
jgi:hypothetical protein